jgi:hypothetical protein
MCGLTHLEICEFAIAEWAQEFADDLRPNKKFACPPFILETMFIPAWKINILWDMADLIPYLVPT